ncbi:MAG: glycoside hydrolase family 3 protein [Ruminiclostridium sp.]
MAIKLDWEKYIEASVETVSEGIVMLKNDNGALPLEKDRETAVFGRIQLHYYKSGTGSGGMVNVSEVVGITDGLLRSGAKINEELLSVYKEWDKDNPYNRGSGWGTEPWSQAEMPLSDELVKKISLSSDTAVVIIGRTAGEEQDNTADKGAYFLSDLEEDMLKKVRANFRKMVVLLNVGGIIDMGFVDRYCPDAVLYVWQGGMVGGIGTARVLLGDVSPSGKLPDTIAYEIADCPADKNFGDLWQNFYCEDIYVGYRYFETFAKDRVRYPFGFGLSYTSFSVTHKETAVKGRSVSVTVTVKNTGSFTGKEVIELYYNAPQGALGQPLRQLCAFEKTKNLAPAEEQELTLFVNLDEFAAYDDSGITGHESCFVLEKGEHRLFVGTDVRADINAGAVVLEETIVIKQYRQALAPVQEFSRIRPVLKDGKYEIEYEKVPVLKISEDERRKEKLPEEIPYTGDKGIKLSDVKTGKNTMEEFIAQLSDYDLSCIIRGEGMSSPKVTPGTAAAFGGVSESLKGFGIPCGCCADGPSGMRLDCGTKAFSLPNGTLIASTFNKELINELYTLAGQEIAYNNVDCLLGPGMNIHRHPLNGRNFEYFSEDPYLTGIMAAYELMGLHKSGVTGTIKHFCGNNQESGRHVIDSIISERALREIYLKGFETAINKGGARSIMTTYGRVNGLYTGASYDLTGEILRNQWGFKGIAMTDWWTDLNERNCEASKDNFAAMARAWNDIYMVCSDSENNCDNTLSCLENGSLKRSELQRNAATICGMLMNMRVMDRFLGRDEKIEIINREDVTEEIDMSNVKQYELSEELEISLADASGDEDSNYVFLLDLANRGMYEVTMTASCNLSSLAQVSVTMFVTGTPTGFIWNGTEGEDVAITKQVAFPSRFTPVRLYFPRKGLKPVSIKFRLVQKF